MTAERLMVAFAGTELPPDVADFLSSHPVAGVTLFRHENVTSPAQVRALTAALQAAAPANARPLLIAADQEGGQLNGLGDGLTAFAGAMALGAAADEDLAQRVAAATARELRALGVNVDYAPVCDLATNPRNPVLGIRSFGDDPAAVARLAAATVRGLQAEGVAATAKHFPGLGDAAADTHDGRAVIDLTGGELEQRELLPFRAALSAGARLVMVGHVTLPWLDDSRLPASLSPTIVSGLLRDDLGFDGLAITDALDMGALAEQLTGSAGAPAALEAGNDLLLGTPRLPLLDLAWPATDDELTRRRLAELRAWLAGFDQPPLGVVGCAEHRAVADELARRSVTLVRDDAGLLPLRLAAEARVLVIQPRPTDLTPADTTSLVPPTLADAIRRRHPRTDGLIANTEPAAAEIAALRGQAAGYDLIVIGSDAAHLRPAQAALVRVVLATGRPTLTVALRTPWDLAVYPESASHACSYGILPPSLEALAAALFGEHDFAGRLPVALAGLYPGRHGLSLGQPVGG